jgi:hypothetical protein
MRPSRTITVCPFKIRSESIGTTFTLTKAVIGCVTTRASFEVCAAMGELKAQRLINMSESSFRGSGGICITLFSSRLESGNRTTTRITMCRDAERCPRLTNCYPVLRLSKCFAHTDDSFQPRNCFMRNERHPTVEKLTRR